MLTIKKLLTTQAVITIAAVMLTTGCSTTQEFKPTASVMVGPHKPL
ncbi:MULTISPECIES: hypothetical protein [Psychrobacter]|nr:MULTISPECIES: hypothetical protein [Psychrobacter]